MHSRSRAAWAAVTGVLLDHVLDDCAHLPRLARDEGLAEVVVLRVDLARVRHLPPPRLPGVRHAVLGPDRAVEIEARLVRRVSPVSASRYIP
jgi:hypothetical protein